MLSIIWGVGAAIIFLAGFIYMAWVDGQGEYIEHDEWLMSVVLLAGFWWVLLSVAILVAPFFGLYHLVRNISSSTRGVEKSGSEPCALPLRED